MDPVVYGGVPYSAEALDPMAPVAVGGLLPPGAETAAPVTPYQPGLESAMPAVSSPARALGQRERQAAWGLALAAVGGIALLVAVGVAYVIVAEHLSPKDNALADNQTEPATQVPAPTTRSDRSTIAEPSPSSESTTTSAPKPAPMRELAPALVPPADSVPSPSPPVPAPVAPPAPSPSAAPPSAPMPMITPDEVQALIKALDAAKTALAEQNFKKADLELTKAESLAKLPKHKEAVARLKEVGGYVNQFRQAVAGAVKEMQAGESFKVGTSTHVAFVEGSSDKVTLRLPGMNKTYAFNDMPPGLAVAIAEFKLAASDPMSRVVKGAYLLVHKRADSETQAKAKSLWQEAQLMGANILHLMPFLNDNYADLLKDVPAE